MAELTPAEVSNQIFEKMRQNEKRRTPEEQPFGYWMESPSGHPYFHRATEEDKWLLEFHLEKEGNTATPLFLNPNVALDVADAMDRSITFIDKHHPNTEHLRREAVIENIARWAKRIRSVCIQGVPK